MKIKLRYYFVLFIRLIKDSISELLINDPLRMAGATAFFTTFALPPILVILIQAFKLVLGPMRIRNRLFETLAGIVGNEAVEQIKDILNAFRNLAHNWYVILGGFIFLVFVATTLFKIIKDSINQIWKIRVLERRAISSKLLERLQAVLVILFAGILFVFGLLVETSQAFLGNYIQKLFPSLAFYFNNVVRTAFSVLFVTLWFAIMFRYLPDGRPRWKTALTGAFVTSLLFNGGKVLLRFLLSYNNLNSIYGTSTSIVLLLLFVFYSSLILYFGAAFTKVWSIYKKQPIKPLKYAVNYQITIMHEER
ncbi:YihY/virulence factor BrkB family protein [Flavisolibacter tropicus]|uniref:YihY/virulence factor BrkB family protein n=1 Tax=Flavisolibacter tropicus TaxID=1492898 RepID=UPI0009ED222F|nr:YihY/virulence factor BrkB family protein [Flavisolibacter tropicus]